MKILFLLLAAIPLSVKAGPCQNTDQTEQWVILTEGFQDFMAWKVNPEEIKPVTMNNGFEVGLKINPVSNDFYLERLKSQKAVPELVQITVFDLSEESPRELAMTYGGANSIQGYSAGGGATTVTELGPKGLEFLLHKTACVTQEILANR